MKKLLFSVMAMFLLLAVFAQTKTYNFPYTGETVFTIKIPVQTWSVTNEESYFSFAPVEETDYGRMIGMIWMSDDPNAEDAVTLLVEESFDLVETLLTDIEWDEETSEFQINEIDFVAIDGWGYYTNEDGSKDEMMTSIMIFFPDDDNLVTFVYVGLEIAYTKYKDEFLGIIQSISPY